MGAVFLINAVVVVAACSYLGVVGYAYHLGVAFAGALLHHDSHLVGHTARHAGVYLVEDDGGQLLVGGEHSFEGKHHSCYLTARCYFLQTARWHALVGTEEEAHFLLTVTSQLVEGDELYYEIDVWHTQWLQAYGELLLYLGGSLMACGAEFICCVGGFAVESLTLLALLGNDFFVVDYIVELCLQLRL